MPEFPKSLYLIHPLVSAYPLNPVASAAQANVPIPEGLDLDKWIVPPPKDVLLTPATEGEERGRKPKKKKGKKKESSGKTKEKPKNELLQEDALTPAPETEEEKAERERASSFIAPPPRLSLVLTLYSQKRLERIERLKDDPYYIFDKREIEKPIPPASSDVDSIPIVRLDDLMPIAPSPPYPTCRDITALLIFLHRSTSTTRDYPPRRSSNTATSKAKVCGRQGG